MDDTTAEPAPPPRMKTSPYAIASLVVGLVGLCSFGLTAPFGVGLAFLGLRQIRRSPDEYTGRGIANAGLGLVATSLAFATLFFGFMKHRYQEVTSVATDVTRELQTGQLTEVREHFTDAVRASPSFEPQLDSVARVVAARGPLEALSFGSSMALENEITRVTYDAEFEGGSAILDCAFVEEDGEWRLVDYHIHAR
ncbi:MAG: DUF4190 domain-containing protein [Sandaracinaceae bacterium]